jgi:acyl carrier protein
MSGETYKIIEHESGCHVSFVDSRATLDRGWRSDEVIRSRDECQSLIQAKDASLPPTPLPARTALEGRIARYWCELTGGDRVTCDTNFFALGATSLAAVKFLGRLQQWTGVDLPADVLMRGSLKDVAAFCEKFQPERTGFFAGIMRIFGGRASRLR